MSQSETGAETGAVRIGRRGAVGWIKLNRPERFNSLDITTARDLRRAGLQLARDEGVRCVVLQGLPEVFCSGVDLQYVREGGRPEDLAYLTPGTTEPAVRPGAVFKQILEYTNGALSEIRRAPKPFVAAVEGVAAAGGMGLALCCDLVVASERAHFEWAYGKTGLSGAESITFLLPRLIGLRGALDLALLSPRLDALQARQRGLVSLVLSPAEFRTGVEGLAARLAALPPGSVARTKRLLNRAVGMDGLEAQLGLEVEDLVASANSEEFARGLELFFARRRTRDTRG